MSRSTRLETSSRDSLSASDTAWTSTPWSLDEECRPHSTFLSTPVVLRRSAASMTSAQAKRVVGIPFRYVAIAVWLIAAQFVIIAVLGGVLIGVFT